jgi:hypothetical protein
MDPKVLKALIENHLSNDDNENLYDSDNQPVATRRQLIQLLKLLNFLT